MGTVEELAANLEAAQLEAQDHLSFGGRGLKLNSQEDVADIVRDITSFNNMVSLTFSGNTIGVDASEAIGKALEKHSTLQKLFWSDMFTGRLKAEIPKALKLLGAGLMVAQAQLTWLDLSDNAFGPNGIVGVVDLLKSKCCFTLKTLKLNNNGLGITGGSMLAETLTECHKNSASADCPLNLKVFVCGRNRLENAGASKLADFFQLLGTLEHVAMPQNGIHVEGISALAACFRFNPNLKVINLNDNTFTEVGAEAMAKSLPSLENLETLDFGDCIVRTGGVLTLAKALQSGHLKLTDVNFSFNEIEAEGAVGLAKALCSLPSLQRLDLNGNEFGRSITESVKLILEDANLGDVLCPIEDAGSGESDGSDAEVEEKSVDVPDSNEVKESKTVSDQPKGLLSKPIHILLRERRDGAVDQEVLPVLVQLLIDVCMALEKELSDESAVETACSYADELFNEMLKVKDENINGAVANCLLTHLGLLKSEDKLQPVSSLVAPLMVLEHCVRQSYFPKPIVSTLLCFLDRPSKLFSTCTVQRCNLMQAMYSV